MLKFAQNIARILRLRYPIRDDERYNEAPGFLPYQCYVVQQMGFSRSTVSRLLKKAVRAISHPQRRDRLHSLAREIKVSDIRCPAEYMVADIFGLDNRQ